MKWGIHFDIAKKEDLLKELEYKMSDPSFWDDTEKASNVTRELNGLKNSISVYNNLLEEYDETFILWSLAMEEKDESLEADIYKAIKSMEESLEKLEMEILLSEEYDKNNAILTLHAGAGGTEAQDWTQMLLRMYVRWAEKNGFDVDTMDLLPGDEAGVKSVTLLIKGHNAYGYLKSEKGVHRLVRISPFDANSRRHTSFSACDVMPEIDDNVEVDIDMNDVRVDTYRASGAGGQHINKTDSAVRMTHIPTGIVAQCQNERSQLKNREQCLKLLRARLFELEMEKKEAEMAKLEGEMQKIEWGSQIRSYVFHPYNMVKDHRTNAETSDTQSVMDGNLNKFMEAYLEAKANHRL